MYSNKIMYVLYHYEFPSYLFVHFLRFSSYLARFLRPQSVLEKNSAVFMQPTFKDWAIYPVALLFYSTVAFLTFFTAATVIIFSELLEFE